MVNEIEIIENAFNSIEKINLEVQQKNKLNNKFKSEIKLTKPNN